jgi:hypothetical protein
MTVSNERRTIPAWQQGTALSFGMGSPVWFRQHAQDVPGVIVEIQQTGKHRGKWAVRNEKTGRTVWRSTRALRGRIE